MHEAAVVCRTCKQVRWVDWDIRHDGSKPGAPERAKARCPSGKDLTDYNGHRRGEPPVKGFA